MAAEVDELLDVVEQKRHRPSFSFAKILGRQSMVIRSDCVLFSCFPTSRLGYSFSMGLFSVRIFHVASTGVLSALTKRVRNRALLQSASLRVALVSTGRTV